MRQSTSYVGTFYTGSAGDMLEIETIRKAVKAVNEGIRNKHKYAVRYARLTETAEPGSPTQFRVCLKARGPRTKHARADGKHPRAYDQSLPLRHAERVDAYVYER